MIFSKLGRKHPRLAGSIALIVGLLALVALQTYVPAAATLGGPRPSAPTGGLAAAPGAPADAPLTAASANGIMTGYAYQHDVSPALRDMKPLHPAAGGRTVDLDNPAIPLLGHKDEADGALQNTFGPLGVAAMPAPATGWEGINQAGGCGNCAPPDTNGEAGATQYVQTVNSSFAVWSKTGTLTYGPAAINTIWQGFGGACQTRNDGDPVVLYDQIAGRWLMSQFTAASPYDECIAVSTTSDATGTWNRYAFQLSTTDFPDYPKLGVWPDGYYMSVNWFTNGQSYAGPRPYVFNRTAMLNGAAASFQTTSAALGSSVSPVLPSDLDGSLLPASGQPNVFAEFGSSMALFKFHVDWATPANTTWTNSATLAVAGFTQLCGSTRNCIAQAGTSQKLDGIGDRLMHRLAFRHFADGHEALAVTMNVKTGGTSRAPVSGVRWYEVRDPAGTPSIYQQGTYSPDSNSRWMGSVAMDKVGDLAVGYSVSSGSVHPSIRYAGRVPGDTLGTLNQGEASMYTGTGSQAGVNRWGDYSAMTIDPSDDCTFWYTQEYNNSGGWGWGTRIGSFKFGTCQ